MSEKTNPTLQIEILKNVVFGLLPLGPNTHLQITEIVSEQNQSIKTQLSFERPGAEVLRFTIPKPLAEISEEDIVRVLVYRKEGGCSHPHT
jgi:hypothetical protein